MKRIFLFFFATAVLQLSAQVPADNRRLIEVNGTSEMDVAPDEIFVNLTLLERMDGKEKVSIEKQENDLKKALKDCGIELSALTLNNAMADYRTIRKKAKDVLVSKNYTVKISGTDQLSKFYEKLDQMNVYDAYVARYTTSKLQDYQKENRVKAIKLAKEKADYLLAALGQSTGQPVLVSETENYVQEGNDLMYKGKMMAANSRMTLESTALSATDDEQISFRKIKIRNTYFVKFEILAK